MHGVCTAHSQNKGRIAECGSTLVADKVMLGSKGQRSPRRQSGGAGRTAEAAERGGAGDDDARLVTTIDSAHCLTPTGAFLMVCLGEGIHDDGFDLKAQV
jgi:hypothetical protein